MSISSEIARISGAVSTQTGLIEQVKTVLYEKGSTYEDDSLTHTSGISGNTTRMQFVLELANALPEAEDFFGKSAIVVTAPTGSTIYVTDQNGVRKDAAEENGTWTFNGCDVGVWAINATLDGKTATKNVVIEFDGQLMRYLVTVGYQVYASDFDWTSYGTLGVDYQIVYDDDTEIPEELWESAPNWKARLLSSGTLTSLTTGKIDVFLVGGGGGPGKSGTYQHAGAGGGGYTLTEKKQEITINTIYEIEIGAGGSYGADGGATTAFGLTANGGLVGHEWNSATALTDKKSQGGNGGSGGGAGSSGGTSGSSTSGPYGGDGGTDGGNGGNSTYDSNTPGGYRQGGKGQGTTTREFGEEDARLYSNGGSGKGRNNLETATSGDLNGKSIPNSGNGGRSGNNNVGSSGIVVIRNARN